MEREAQDPKDLGRCRGQRMWISGGDIAGAGEFPDVDVMASRPLTALFPRASTPAACAGETRASARRADHRARHMQLAILTT